MSQLKGTETMGTPGKPPISRLATASVILAGLLPIMWSHGTGADVMKRIAAPMVGGVVTSVVMELGVYPVIYYLWKGRKLKNALEESAQESVT